MDQQAAPWHFVATVGDLALRNVIVLIVVIVASRGVAAG